MPSPTPVQVFAVVVWLDRRTRRHVVVGAVLVVTFVILRSAPSIAQAVLDRWWYRTVTRAPIWSTRVAAEIQLGVAAGVVSAVVLGSSVYLSTRMTALDGHVPGGPLGRYRARMGPAHRWLMIGIVVVLTFRITREATHHWQEWLLFRHGSSLDRPIPELGGDLGYYLFDLPFLDVVSTWLRQLLLAAIAVAAFGYLVGGALRLPFKGARSTPGALVHLALLGVCFAAVQALDYVLVRQPSFGFDSTGSFVGAGFTALRVGVPATYALAVVAIVCGALLVDATRRNRWIVAVVALGIWAVLHLLLLGILPAVVQRYVVGPAEGTRELPYLAHNLEATRQAFGLDTVDEVSAPMEDGVPDPARVTSADLGDIPLFDASRLAPALQVLEGRTATRITDVDLDRYALGDGVRPVLVGARSPSRDDLPAQGWVQAHLVYTHGDGVVAVPAATTDADGRPDVDALDTELSTARPQLYYGEGLADWYAIVGTKRTEQGGAVYADDNGIALDSLWRRAVLAVSSGDVEPLLSAELTSDSQLLYRRDVTERLAALAPFLTFDADPYPIVTDAGVTWVVDGYTTAGTAPYAEYSRLGGTRVNYAHSSVKATIDAYDGTVHLYRTEVGGADDPILDAWSDIFPDLVEPIADLPTALRDHLLYPPDLLDVQSALLGRYHVDDAETLFNGTEQWSPAAAPIPGVGQPAEGSAAPVTQILPADQPVAGGHFAAAIPYNPGTAPGSSTARDLLAALGLADHDEAEHLRLLSIDGSGGEVVSSPTVAQSAIDADPELAAEFALLNANGSTVSFGPMTPTLIDDGLVWIRSVIVTGTATTAVPRVYGVAAVSGGMVGFGADPLSALADAGSSG